MSREKLVDFAWRVYAQPAVESACRDLQDTHYANVNLVLWLAWLQQQAVHLEKTALESALDLIGNLSGDTVALLRVVRTNIKARGGFTKVQEQLILKNILQAEIAIEKILLERLQDMTGRMPRIAEPDLPPLSLVDYFESLHIHDATAAAQSFLSQLEHQPLLAETV
jgi:uncharacterized protein (TIGR02444 family)